MSININTPFTKNGLYNGENQVAAQYIFEHYILKLIDTQLYYYHFSKRKDKPINFLFLARALRVRHLEASDIESIMQNIRTLMAGNRSSISQGEQSTPVAKSMDKRTG